jgi:DNA polymerase-4
MSEAASWPRVIVHADMDAFYAAVEQLDDPSLRGKPLLIGPNGARGVVLTASYEARPFGVGSAMPMHRARRLCPQALVVPPRFDRYQQISRIIMTTFGEFSPLVEPLSLDEAFLDMTGSERLLGSPERIGRRIKAAVREATGGLTASLGVSGTKYVAKVASGFAKPDGLTCVPPGSAREWLAPMPVSSLWGAGAKTSARLQTAGYETIGQIATAELRALERSFGAMGRRFHALANAHDARPVDGSHEASSVGSEHTLNADIRARHDIEEHLRLAAETVAQRLRRRSLVASGVRIKLKRSDFRVLTRQGSLTSSTDVAATLFKQACVLLSEVDDRGPFRLIGLAAYELERRALDPQLSFVVEDSRARRLETALDRVAERFGRGAVIRATELTGDRGLGLAANLDFLDEEEGG